MSVGEELGPNHNGAALDTFELFYRTAWTGEALQSSRTTAPSKGSTGFAFARTDEPNKAVFAVDVDGARICSSTGSSG